MSEWVKPVPYVDAVSKPFWDATLEGRLTFQECPDGHRQFYPRAVCATCGQTPGLVDAAGTGTVHTFTIIRQYGGAGFKDELPYVVAMIELDEGPRMMGNVTDVDPETVRIGDRVQVWFAEADERSSIPLWRPI
jgi:uncharacterized OB-fold protein